MECVACSFANPDRSLFCGRCGATLTDTQLCGACRTRVPATFKFCNECGKPLGGQSPSEKGTVPPRDPHSYTPKHLADKILQSKSALEGERKQVTVLFADIKGSMELAEQLDPEQWHNILDRFFQILTDGVHRFEGTVNQYTGDGIMALFGAPIAHEDHAQRACWAALSLRDEVRRYADELRRTHGLNFSVRMGINSGDVVVGCIGNDLRMDYTAQGHTVGLAQRMEQLAEPGTTCMTEHTRELVEGYFELRGLGSFSLKGVSASTEVWVLEGVGRLRTRLDLSRARGFSRFVGRTGEMETLQGALSSALAGGGQIAGVVGEAGVGKSRLCSEFIETCRARGISVWEAHCPAHGRAVPMLPLLELTRRFFGIEERDSPAEARRKIAGTLALLDEHFATDLSLAFDFLQVPDPERPLPPMDPDAHRKRLLAFVRQLFEARSTKQAAVLYLDDLHWIDDESDAFLAQIVEAIAPTRTMLLLNFRPEYQAAWMNRTDYRRIPVLPLGPGAIDEMLSHLLGDHASVASLARRIRERADGNPFFTEELVRAFFEAGVLAGEAGSYRLVHEPEEAVLPANVQGVLSARIDRLPERDKHVLQAAAVIGREFDDHVLRRITGLNEDDLTAPLHALRSAEFVYETALYPVAEYAFKHPLTQEVAYASQLAEHRLRTHAAVGRAMIEEAGDRLDERSALIAHHLEAGGEREEAASWHARAARWSSVRDADVSLHQWRRVRELLSSLETPEILRLRAEACREILFTTWRAGEEESEWEAAYEEGVDLARRTDDKRTLAMLLSGVAGIRAFGGEHRRQVELLEEALQVARGAGDFALEASLLQRVGWAWGLAGSNHRQHEWSERALAFCEHDAKRAGPVGGFHTVSWLYAQRGWSLLYYGRFTEAERDFERARAIAEKVNDDFTREYVRAGLFHLAWLRLDRDEMRRWVLPAEREGAVTPYAYTDLGNLLLEEGDWAAAADACEKAVLSFRARGAGRVKAFYLEALADWALALARGGAPDRAREILGEIRGAISAQPELAKSVFLVLSLVRALLAVEGPAACDEILRLDASILQSAREDGFVTIAPFALQYRGELAGLVGDEAAYARDLREATALFRNFGCDARARQIEEGKPG